MNTPLRILRALILALAIPAMGAAGQAPPPQASPILAPIDAMFQGMTQRDAAAIKAAAIPGAVLVLMRDGKPNQMTIEAFAERVGKPGKTHIEERIHDPLVRVDHDLAMVWAPFEFLVDGQPDHCGTDLFNLVQTDGKWLVAGIADTGSKDCAAK
jgi:Putative lumazine-binding